MQRHTSNHGVLLEPACGVLKNLSGSSNKVICSIADGGGFKALIPAMMNSQTNECVQTEGCGALLNLSVLHENEELIIEAGGISAVMVALKTHPQSIKLASNACGTLKNLAATSDENRNRIATEGGIGSIVSVMGEHIYVAQVQERACGALKNLSILVDLKHSMIEARCIQCLRNAQARHQSNKDVQRYAAAALANLLKSTGS
ncbi:armadillo repeat containing 6 [Seminavis robusta]|uniref:Armadillo repeat containing 6 n=1 Tax=Seminavis robusta TaxID=568900 RepID=A0A9N8DSA0_9STRA|nr:armadillo repeat containing 6 [Seminavis robusta]|eukprot:Sro320_g116420.1 armadillo repeat containing 6 (203) ;mRNA; f:7542-8150